MVHVDTFDDVLDDSDGVTSLREAVMEANNNPGDYEIVLSEGTYTLTIDGALDLDGATGDLNIRNQGRVMIAGAGAEATIIDANGLFDPQQGSGDRVFSVQGGTLVLEAVTITGGGSTHFSGHGGAIVAYYDSTVTVVDSVLSGNTATFGGAIASQFGATVQVINSTIAENSAYNGGGVYLWDGGTVEISNSTFSDNSARNSGGAVFVYEGALNIADSVISGNFAEVSGGGIHILQTEATVTGATLAGNMVGRTGGVTSSGGGAIYNRGTLSVASSTISGNSAITAHGGGVHNGEDGSATIVNSTISGNSTWNNGGGIFNEGGTVTVAHSTVANNRADDKPTYFELAEGMGGGAFNESGTFTLSHSIVVGNFRGQEATPDDLTTAASLDAASSWNLIGDAASADILEDGVNGNILATARGVPILLDPLTGEIPGLLGPLADNGGLTLTHALVDDSLALDAGDPDFNLDAFDPPLLTDQRGLARVVGGRIDIGAVESDIASTSGGPIAFDTPTPEHLAQPGDVHEWTFSGQAGQSLAIVATLGATITSVESLHVDVLAPDGTVLEPGNSTASGRTLSLPGIVLPTDGTYRVRVRASDAHPETVGGYVLTVRNVPLLELGAPQSGSVAAGESLWFRIDAKAGRHLAFELDGLPTDGIVEMYVREGDLPNRTAFDASRTQPFVFQQYIFLPERPEARTYYVLVFAPALASSPAEFELTVSEPAFEVRTRDFGTAGNGGDFTLKADGALFNSSTEVRLSNDQGFEQPALWVVSASPAELFANFDLRGVEPGLYNVVFTAADGRESIVPRGLEVVAAEEPARVDVRVIAPSAIRQNREFSFTIEWENTSLLNDAPAPLLTVGVEGSLPDHPVAFGPDHKDYSLWTRHTFLGVSTQGGPAGVLRPGQRESRTFWAHSGKEPGDYTVFVEPTYADPEAPFDWDFERASLKPGDLTDEEFEPIFQQLVNQVGTTIGDYLRMLARNANLVAGSADDLRNVNAILELEVTRAWAAVSRSISGALVGEEAEKLVGDIIIAENLTTGEDFAALVLTDRTFTFAGMSEGEYRIIVPGYDASTSSGDTFTLTGSDSVVGLAVTPERFDLAARLRENGVGEESIEMILASQALAEGGEIQSSPDHAGIVTELYCSSVTPFAVGFLSWFDPLYKATEDTANPTITQEYIECAQKRLREVGSTFKVLGGSFATRHLASFMSGSATPIDYPDGHYISDTAKRDRVSRFSHRDAHKLVEPQVKSYLESLFRGAHAKPSSLTFQAMGIGLGLSNGPNFFGPDSSQKRLHPFTWPIELFPADRLNLTAGFGDMSGGADRDGDGRGDHGGEVVSIRTRLSGRKLEYEATIRYEWRDRYTFGNDRGKSGWDNAGHYLEVAGIAKPFEVSITIEEEIKGSVLLPDDGTCPEGEAGDTDDGGIICTDPGGGGVGDGGDAANIDRPASWDPNDIIGPAAFGPENHIVANSAMPYTIRFENDAEKATAPAAEVTITQKLDDDLDLRTFRLGDIGFGETIVDVPEDTAFFQTRVDLTATHGVFVDITAGIDPATLELRWQFRSIDPETGELPEDPFVGFLPPNVNGPEGEGFVTYTVRPKSDVATGDRVDAEASIVFDLNEPIVTPAIFHTFDIDAPSSQVAALPAETASETFVVSWTGDDGPGSGIAGFDVYVSTDDGPYELWLAGHSELSAEFTGEDGRSYRFYVIATDNVGWTEPAKADAEAQTTISVHTGPPWRNSIEPADVNDDGDVNIVDVLAVVQHLRDHGSGHLLPVPPTPDFLPPPYVDVDGDGMASVADLLAVVQTLRDRMPGAEGEAAASGRFAWGDPILLASSLRYALPPIDGSNREEATQEERSTQDRPQEKEETAISLRRPSPVGKQHQFVRGVRVDFHERQGNAITIRRFQQGED